MTIYQWMFFDREECFFEHVESTSKEEADRQGWEYFSNYMDIVKDDEEFNSTTAEKGRKG